MASPVTFPTILELSSARPTTYRLRLGEIYGEWLDKFAVKLKVDDDAISTLGWARYLLSMCVSPLFRKFFARQSWMNSY